ncbi:ImmA/IrrE family metallo-endopeptidase [Streptomyces zaomyceticus]|uniref:ImmA/IrrE family metallo-endopeptidase n=1 Tax=Streptomyces zaomyceticus TaxID=68286 RepID=UPI00368B12C2
MSLPSLTTSWEIPEGETRDVRTATAQRRVRRIFEDLGLPPHPTMEELCKAYEAKSGRSLQLIEREMQPGEPSGEYERYLLEDRIYYPKGTSPAHQALVQCHELAHLLLGHTLKHNAISPDVIRRVLGREHYTEESEFEAEIVGSVLFLELNLEPAEGAAAQLAPALTHREGRHA